MNSLIDLQQALATATANQDLLAQAIEQAAASLATDQAGISQDARTLHEQARSSAELIVARKKAVQERILAVRARSLALKDSIVAQSASIKQQVVALQGRVQEDISRIEAGSEQVLGVVTTLENQIEAAGDLVQSADSRIEALQGEFAARVAALKDQSEQRQQALLHAIVQDLGGTVEDRVESLVARLQHIQEQLQSFSLHTAQESTEHTRRILEESHRNNELRGGRLGQRAGQLKQGFRTTGSTIEATATGLSAARDGVVVASTAANAGLSTVIGIVRELIELFTHHR